MSVSSLRGLGDLRVSAVNMRSNTLTAETQRTQRRRGEFQLGTLAEHDPETVQNDYRVRLTSRS